MRFQKRFNFGPMRINLSGSGIGVSAGVPGARVGIGPRGTYSTVGIPGTGLSQTWHHGHAAMAPTGWSAPTHDGKYVGFAIAMTVVGLAFATMCLVFALMVIL